MEYNLTANGEPFTVTVSPTEGDAASNTAEAEMTIAGNRYAVAATRVEGNHLHLKVNGRGMNVYVGEGEAGRTVMVNGLMIQVADAEDAARSPQGKRRAKRGPQEVTSPTPAVVTSVLVAAGDRVAEGQGVVVVTAMKMETTLTAPYGGVVTAMNTEAGANVNPGDILVEIERDADGNEGDADDDGQ
ncbi:MAG: biotin/lipoyl-containing protein [Thermodesulfobacteriota bacterium]|nr:biotin/lipoyl-containing protein [Thermodesulfobacteriota bacterium]